MVKVRSAKKSSDSKSSFPAGSSHSIYMYSASHISTAKLPQTMREVR